MTIIFDFEIAVNQQELLHLCSGTRGKVLLELKAFLRERLSPLKEEIDATLDTYIMICAFIEPKFQIRYYHFSESLQTRMMALVSQQDMKFIIDNLWTVMPDVKWN